MEVPFFAIKRLCVIRHYSVLQEGERMLCVVALPSFVVLYCGFLDCFHVGEIHRRGELNSNSRSPLSEPVLFMFVSFGFNSDDGEIHRRGDVFCNSRSPLFYWKLLVFVVDYMSGRFTV